MNVLIDSHCHLNDSLYKEKNISSKELIENAKNNNVMKIVNVSTSLEDCEEVIDLAHIYKGIYATVGVHPVNVLNKPLTGEDIEFLKKKTYFNHVIAIGEAGLDYHYAKTTEQKNNQIDAFIKQIKLAQSVDLPIVIHCRDAWEDLIEILTKYKIKGIIHCYTGTLEIAKKLINLGFYISFSGIITFKNAQNFEKIITEIPVQKILIETDAPYLAPEPYRGNINKPEYLNFIAKKISNIKKMDNDKLIRHIENNIQEILNI